MQDVSRNRMPLFQPAILVSPSHSGCSTFRHLRGLLSRLINRLLHLLLRPARSLRSLLRRPTRRFLHVPHHLPTRLLRLLRRILCHLSSTLPLISLHRLARDGQQPTARIQQRITDPGTQRADRVADRVGHVLDRAARRACDTHRGVGGAAHEALGLLLLLLRQLVDSGFHLRFLLVWDGIRGGFDLLTGNGLDLVSWGGVSD